MAQISEKHKLYLLITMVVLAVVIGYFRFFRPADSGAKQTLSPDATNTLQEAKPAAFALQTDKLGSSTSRPSVRRSISRNIFEPTASLPTTTSPKPTSQSPPPADMTLTGTVIGGDLSMAIINNQFVRQGQVVGKYKITRITPDQVFLASKDDQLCLNVLSVTEAITE